MASEASKTNESQDQGQTASSQPSQAPTAAEPRNTNTDETMMGRAPQSAREKTAMEKVGVMMWPSWVQRASGLLGPCILEPAGPWTQIPLIELRINRAIGPSGP